LCSDSPSVEAVDVEGKDLTHTLDVIEHANFLIHALANPNRGCVGVRACTTQIKRKLAVG
jgi:hypothetical protein